MFVLHVDTFKARAMFTPRSHVIKNPVVPSADLMKSETLH